MQIDGVERGIRGRFGFSSVPILITSPLTKAPVTFYRLRRDGPDETAKRLPRQDAYAISIALHAAGPCETWLRGRKLGSDMISEGATAVLTLESGLSTHCRSASDYLGIHIPKLAIEEFANDAGLRRPSHLRAPFIITPDSILLHFARAVLPALERPTEMSSLFLDYIALATNTHVLYTYLSGSAAVRPRVGGLAPWQERRAKALMTARLHDRRLSMAELASECGMSCSHFARAFRQSTGLPPHRWWLGRRVAKVKELMLADDRPLKEVASACGFGDQSHLTRVFSRIVGESPATWRRTRKT